MNLPSLKEITDKAILAFKRFPVTLTWALVGSFFCMYVIDDLFDVYSNSLLTFILGISWFIGTHFFLEQQKNPRAWQWLKLGVLILLILFYLHLPNTGGYNLEPVYYIRFFLYLLGGHLFLSFAPFAFTWNKEAYWNYLKNICIAIGRSVLFSGILYVGLVLALAAMESLFDLDIDGKRYGQLFIFCAGVVNTWTYLSDFPKNIQQQTTIHYNKVLEVLVTYILIPLVILYLIILYAYSIKIVWEWNLPKGWVSYLVTALAFLGFLVQVMIHPVQKTLKSWSINRFYPTFYVLLLPLIALLFTAIFTRIGDYGITENRYFVLVLSFWILAMVLYLLIRKGKRLKVLPMSLLLVALLTSFGFWGAFQVSQKSQVLQFRQLYKKATANHKTVTGEQYKRMESILHYLGDRNAVSALDTILGISIQKGFKDTTDNKYPRNYVYNMPERVLDSLNIIIDPKDSLGIILVKGNYYNYYHPPDKLNNYQISGYDYFSAINFNGSKNIPMQVGQLSIRYRPKKNQLVFTSELDTVLLLAIPLKNKLLMLAKQGQNIENVEEDKLTLTSSNEHFSIKMILTNVSFQKRNDSILLNNLNAYLFLKQH